MCISLGGRANVLDSKDEQRGLKPLSTGCFPQDIPMPPTAFLPAKFECQLCLSAQQFKIPRDWTNHVYEDIQPFACTWEGCNEGKMFKRKADWVLHENAAHRHVRWWTCDVDDCRKKFPRRNNFLNHLNRGHSLADIPTWVKVKQCLQETTELPQDEPCRFCREAFASQKELTDHLAEHMKQISLTVIELIRHRVRLPGVAELTTGVSAYGTPARTLPYVSGSNGGGVHCSHHFAFPLGATSPTRSLSQSHPPQSALSSMRFEYGHCACAACLETQRQPLPPSCGPAPQGSHSFALGAAVTSGKVLPAVPPPDTLHPDAARAPLKRTREQSGTSTRCLSSTPPSVTLVNTDGLSVHELAMLPEAAEQEMVLVGRNPVHRAQIVTARRMGSSSNATGPPALLRTSWT